MARGVHHVTPTRSGASAGLRERSGRESGSPSLRAAHSPRTGYHSSSRAPISPPPLRRSASTAAPKERPSIPATWTVPQLVDRLTSYRHDMRKDHSQLARHTIESTKATDRRVHNGNDLFAELASSSASPDDGQTWRIRFKVCLERL